MRPTRRTWFQGHSDAIKALCVTEWLVSASLLLGCGDGIHTAAPGTTAPAVSTPPAVTSLLITHGGTYSGTWSSDDPDTAAVTVATDEPVVIENAQITSRGDLIQINGSLGANVVIHDVTGTAFDPKIAGKQRGAFLRATGVASLTVEHCTITGTRHGVAVDHSSPATLLIRNNAASNLEDRASDGAGGFQTARPDLGHFVVLHSVSAMQGAEISWNQIVQTMGQSSTEDGVNLYKSQGSASTPILVHDNYFEGASSPATNAYSGNGLIADGDGALPVTAYAVFRANQIVRTSGGGIMIANGHDITAQDNRVVSCGRNPDGSWYARKQVTAISLWNYYSAPDYSSNVITTTSGGMVVPDSNGNAVASDIYANSNDLTSGNNVSGNIFSDVCLSRGTLSLAPEAAERAAWAAKLDASGNTPGVTLH